MSEPTGEDNVLDAETSFSVWRITPRAVKPLATDADHASSGQSNDLALDRIRQAARADPAYFELFQCVKTG